MTAATLAVRALARVPAAFTMRRHGCARDRTPAPGPVSRRGRPRRARGALRALPAARARSRPPLHVHRRAARRPRAGREPRPDQGHRPLRARARHEVHELRRAHDPGRAEAPLPRQGLVAARAARPAGAHARGEPRDRGRCRRSSAARPRCARWPSTSAARSEQVLEAQEAAASYEAASLDAPAARDDGRVGVAGGPARRRRLLVRARRGPRRRSPARGPRCPRSSARCSSCASCTTSRSVRSASGSATRRCTCRGCCGARSTAWRPPQPPHEREGVVHGEALPVVVEVDEHLGPAAPVGDPLGPLVELGLRVVAAPAAVAVVEADERPVGGELVRLERPARDGRRSRARRRARAACL